MSSEEKIKALEERIEVLEKAEHKRTVKKTIGIIWGLIKLGVFIALIFIAWSYIKPYKEKIDMVSEKVENVEKYINDKFSGFKNYFSKEKN